MSDFIIDTPTERTTFDVMAYHQQEALLEAIRERRLAALRVYEDLMAKKLAATNEKLVVKADKLLVKIAKKLETITKALDDIDALRREVSAMGMQLENE